MCFDSAIGLTKGIYGGILGGGFGLTNSLAPSGPGYKKPPKPVDEGEERRRALEAARLRRLRALGSFGLSDTKMTGALGTPGGNTAPQTLGT
jgi:hypothetical protein